MTAERHQHGNENPKDVAPQAVHNISQDRRCESRNNIDNAADSVGTRLVEIELAHEEDSVGKDRIVLGQGVSKSFHD